MLLEQRAGSRESWHLLWAVVAHSLSHVWLFETPWTVTRQASLSITISWSLLKLMSIESVMPSNHLILCCPLLLLPLIFPSIRVFSESSLPLKWPKCWSYSFIISPSNGYSGLISFRIDHFDLFAIQGILKSLLQHQSSNTIFIYIENSKEFLPTVVDIRVIWIKFAHSSPF